MAHASRDAGVGVCTNGVFVFVLFEVWERHTGVMIGESGIGAWVTDARAEICGNRA